MPLGRSCGETNISLGEWVVVSNNDRWMCIQQPCSVDHQRSLLFVMYGPAVFDPVINGA